MASVEGGGAFADGLGAMLSTVMAGIVLLRAGAVGSARAPTATMRTDPPLALALGGAGA